MSDSNLQIDDSASKPQEENQQKASPTVQPPPAQPQQQHWMAMHYPAGAMMFPPHYAFPPPFHQYQPHHPRGHRYQNGSNSENKTVWVGDLHHWMDENYLHSCFASTSEIASIKVIRNKHNGLSEGYGFVEFLSRETAENVLLNFNGTPMPNTDQPFRLNWASFSTGERRQESAPDLSIFVGDLAPDVTDSVLNETFASNYPSVKGAKVVVDVNTGRSKGYGFVRFGDDSEREKAMSEMNGMLCSGRHMRIGPATPKKSTGYQQQGGYMSNGASSQFDGDSSNTTIFVGGLDSNVTDEDLRQPFASFGKIVSVKIPAGKGCGFVQFVDRSNAEEALDKLNGSVIGNQAVRLSWGRNPGNKQFRGDFVNPWVGPYYGGQYYDGYGYVVPPQHDPRMYAAAAYGGGYPVYSVHNQQQVS